MQEVAASVQVFHHFCTAPIVMHLSIAMSCRIKMTRESSFCRSLLWTQASPAGSLFFKEYEITITLREIKVLFCCSPLGSIVRYCFGNRPNWYVWAKHTPPPETSWLHVHNNWIWNHCPRLFVFCSECMQACV